jgi:methyl-accepting chemotaxis protein
MLRKKLLPKILAIVIGVTILGFGILIYKVIAQEEKRILDEKANAAKLMSQPILQTIYKDMLDERAEMTRYLVEGMKGIEGVERIQIIRGNGVEEAFRDFKTLKAVEKEYGELKPEWTLDHPDMEDNVAEGIDNPNFKKFLEAFNAQQNEGGAVGELKKEGASYIETVGGQRLLTYLAPIEERPKCKACHAGEDARGVMMLSISLEEMYGALASNRTKWVIYGFLTIFGVSLFLSIVVKRVVTGPIESTSRMFKEIAEEGDLRRRLSVSSEDEVGMLGRWFNKFIESMQEIIKGIVVTSDEVSTVSTYIGESSKEVRASEKAQRGAFDETMSSIKEMDNSIKTVAESAESLLISSEGASASTLELSAAISEVAENIQQLTVSVGDSASSTNEIAASLKEVASHVNTVFTETEQVGSAATEVDSTIREVASHARELAVLSERVKEDASGIGMAAVRKTREGIDKIKSEVSASATIVDRLGQRSNEIGNIIGVINEVADTTNLLALNATILAAQAGEHGKGFAVVANEVKDLADRTSVSTKEISEMIKLVQEESEVAVESMERSLERVEEGMKLSKDADDALAKIVKSAEESFEMARKVGKATEEQSKGIGTVAESIHKISGMVEEIKKATDEQSKAADGISAATEQMKDIALHVEQSTTEQTKEVKHVSGVITDVAEKMKTVSNATKEKKAAFERIVKALETISEETHENASRTAALGTIIGNLENQAKLLKEKTVKFKV